MSGFGFLKLWAAQGWRPLLEGTRPTVFSLEHKTKESSNNGKSRKHRNTMVRNVWPQWIGFDRTEKDNNNCVAPSNTIDLTTFCFETTSVVTPDSQMSCFGKNSLTCLKSAQKSSSALTQYHPHPYIFLILAGIYCPTWICVCEVGWIAQLRFMPRHKNQE